VKPERLELPSKRELRTYTADHLLDPADPRTPHLLGQLFPRQS
jgi:hypothetical protein